MSRLFSLVLLGSLFSPGTLAGQSEIALHKGQEHLHLASEHASTGHESTAIAYYSEAAREFESVIGAQGPGVVEARKGLVTVYTQLGRRESKYFQLANEALGRLEAVLGSEHQDVLKKRAFLVACMGQFSEAIDIYKNLVSTNSQDCSLWSGQATIHQMAASFARRTKGADSPTFVSQMDEALRSFSRAADLCPNNSTLLRNLGKGYYFAGELAEARMTYEALRLKEPGSFGIVFGAARLNAETGHWREAAEGFERALELNPEKVSIHRLYADVLKSMGEHEKAEEQMALYHQKLDSINNVDIEAERYKELVEIFGVAELSEKAQRYSSLGDYKQSLAVYRQLEWDLLKQLQIPYYEVAAGHLLTQIRASILEEEARLAEINSRD